MGYLKFDVDSEYDWIADDGLDIWLNGTTLRDSQRNTEIPLEAGDVIKINTGFYGGYAVWTVVNGVEYPYTSSASTEDISGNVIVELKGDRTIRGAASYINHIFNYVEIPRQCQISYGGEVIATVPEANFGNAQKTLQCANKYMTTDVDIEFTEV